MLGSGNESFIGVISCVAYFAVIAGNDPRYCFGFALIVIAIHIVWNEHLFRRINAPRSLDKSSQTAERK